MTRKKKILQIKRAETSESESFKEKFDRKMTRELTGIPRQ